MLVLYRYKLKADAGYIIVRSIIVMGSIIRERFSIFVYLL